MKEIMTPMPDGKDIISRNTEYFRLNRAAEILKCTADDLLHVGATGNALILAPVLAEGFFQWPVGVDGIGFDEIEEPFKRKFGFTDRVVLSMDDLAKIEAIGWTIPNSFSSYSAAQEVIDNLQSCMFVPSDQPDEIISQREEEGVVVETWAHRDSKPWKPDSELLPLREIGLYAPWHAVHSIRKDARRTTINQLFISNKELLRLINGQPQDDVALERKKKANEKKPEQVNGHTERHAATRETILKVAIYCKATWPDECGKSIRAWAMRIDDMSHKFWEKGVPPIGRESIERLLGEAVKLPNPKH